ncbi:plasma kallikrein [Mantella aurantiaca]
MTTLKLEIMKYLLLPTISEWRNGRSLEFLLISMLKLVPAVLGSLEAQENPVTAMDAGFEDIGMNQEYPAAVRGETPYRYDLNTGLLAKVNDCITALKQDVYYQGGDKASVFSPDVEYCQLVCTFNPHCIMFSYLNASWPAELQRFACLLKDSAKLSLPELSLTGAVSGHSLKHCTTKIYTCRDKLYPGLDMMGMNYNISKVTSVEQCEERCTNSLHCQFFTYVTENFHTVQLRNMCYLKYSGKGTPTKIRHLANVISGFSLKSCGKSSLDCKRDLFQTLEFSGDTLTSVIAPDVHMCQKICTFYPNCLFFTYLTKDWQEPLDRNRCYIRTSKNGQPTEIPIKDNAISGFTLQYCKSRPSVCPLPILTNADFAGTDLHVEVVSGEKDCQQRCTNNIRCQFFTYKPVQSECNQNKCKCYLKMSSNGLPTAIEHGKGGISGFSMRLCNIKTVGGCGQPVDVQNRIVGGKNSSEGEWPWQVSLHIKLDTNSRHVCGGSIISNQWIITAAHCVHIWRLPKIWIVYSGITKLSSFTPATTKSEIEQIIIHPDYIRAENGSDIALLKLKQPLAYNDHQQAICLPPRQDFKTPNKCSITGWGYTKESGPTADVLQKAEVPLKSSMECQKSYPDVKLNENIVCAGYEQGKIDSCKGDSGGPLACEVDKMWYLIGITSWGEGCAQPDKPGVYTKVTEYIDWIIEQTSMMPRHSRRHLHRRPRHDQRRTSGLDTPVALRTRSRATLHGSVQEHLLPLRARGVRRQERPPIVEQREERPPIMEQMREEQPICTICLCEIVEEDSTILHCTHQFHIGCIGSWLEVDIERDVQMDRDREGLALLFYLEELGVVNLNFY